MIKITDSNGQALYLAAAAIAAVTETGVSSQWRGIRARVKLFDGTEIEASESAGQIAAAVEAQPAAQPKSVDENDSECEAPPIGWRCTRTRGHAGPCAAVVSPEDRAFVERGMRRIRDAVDAERYRCLRSIRHWIIVDGRGYELRDDGLDSAIDDAIAAQKGNHD